MVGEGAGMTRSEALAEIRRLEKKLAKRKRRADKRQLIKDKVATSNRRLQREKENDGGGGKPADAGAASQARVNFNPQTSVFVIGSPSLQRTLLPLKQKSDAGGKKKRVKQVPAAEATAQQQQHGQEPPNVANGLAFDESVVLASQSPKLRSSVQRKRRRSGSQGQGQPRRRRRLAEEQVDRLAGLQIKDANSLILPHEDMARVVDDFFQRERKLVMPRLNSDLVGKRTDFSLPRGYTGLKLERDRMQAVLNQGLDDADIGEFSCSQSLLRPKRRRKSQRDSSTSVAAENGGNSQDRTCTNAKAANSERAVESSHSVRLASADQRLEEEIDQTDNNEALEEEEGDGEKASSRTAMHEDEAEKGGQRAKNDCDLSLLSNDSPSEDPTLLLGGDGDERLDEPPSAAAVPPTQSFSVDRSFGDVADWTKFCTEDILGGGQPGREQDGPLATAEAPRPPRKRGPSAEPETVQLSKLSNKAPADPPLQIMLINSQVLAVQGEKRVVLLTEPRSIENLKYLLVDNRTLTLAYFLPDLEISRLHRFEFASTSNRLENGISHCRLVSLRDTVDKLVSGQTVVSFGAVSKKWAYLWKKDGEKQEEKRYRWKIGQDVFAELCRRNKL